ncbi:MAG: 30S ribosomal protein S12 methylthiotransferase RimO [Thermodesulfovibrionales bacterium]|nr:30S ribosomal protein S12 methylthiotransferase RimO [Thermodesulfovibrionales bacterium]
MSNFYIHTLGCPKNTVDSLQLEQLLIQEGLVNTSFEDADFILINTCTFINEAKEESIKEILQLCNIKNGKKIIVFGCLAQRYKDELMREIPEIDFIIGLNKQAEIVNYCKGHSSKDIQTNLSNNLTKKLTTSYAYLKIAEGCDRKCSFCVIPSIRGRFKGIEKELILKQAREYIHRGYKELILIGQDITAYGKDLKSYNLVALLKDLSRLEGDFHLRLLYLNPSGITDELIELIATENKILKYLDIPLQHSEDRILRLMARQGSRNEYLKLIRKIRKKMPEIALRTTFIVGFPTETEDEFHNLLDFVEEVKFDRLGVFKYSKMEGTKAASIKGHLPNTIKDKRYHKLMSAQAQISYDKNLSLVGRKFKAIFDDMDDLTIIARIYSQAPEIDGVTIIDLRQHPVPQGLNLQIGDTIDVEITSAYEYDLLGKIITV